MQTIRNRVANNGYKTDKFPDLLCKFYLITEKKEGAIENSYCPFYIWKKTNGMNKFIFEGFFDNIIQSFGWHSIEIGVLSNNDLTNNFQKSRFMIEQVNKIEEQGSLKNVMIKSKVKGNELGKVCIYNPDKWKITQFTFFEDKPINLEKNQKIYEILHISSG